MADTIEDIISQAVLRVKGISPKQREKFSNHLKDETDWKEEFKVADAKPRKTYPVHSAVRKTEAEVSQGNVSDSFPSTSTEEDERERTASLSALISDTVRVRTYCEHLVDTLE